MLFSKIVPNCKKLGLLDAGDGWLRDRFTDLGVIQFEDWTDTTEEYSDLDEVAKDRSAALAPPRSGAGGCRVASARWPSPDATTTRCGSSSSAGSARSAATASASRSPTASSSSTAGSCSRTWTCRASISSSPTSPTCGTTPKRVEGVVLTHAHEDHAGGLAFFLRDVQCPIYGSPLSLGLARNRIEEAGMLGHTELIPVFDGERRQIGPFDVEFIPVTHSVPHAFAAAYHTPQGTILHTGDFKIDLTPVDGRRTDLARLGEIANGLPRAKDGKFPGVRCCSRTPRTQSVRASPSPRPRSGSAMRDLVPRQPRQAVHRRELRVAPAPGAAGGRGRARRVAGSVAFVGRSMVNNVTLSREMGLLEGPVEPRDRHRGDRRGSRPARCASSAPGRRASR